MTQEKDKQEITPEYVRELLEDITPGEWVKDIHDNIMGNGYCVGTTWTTNDRPSKENAKIMAAAPNIAQAYLEKCKEVERLKSLESQRYFTFSPQDHELIEKEIQNSLPITPGKIIPVDISPQQFSPWQPIETAPKDGTVVDLWLGDGIDQRVVNVSWEEGEGWYYYELDECVDISEATHWMYPPEPPREE